jgi:hypothetical protein
MNLKSQALDAAKAAYCARVCGMTPYEVRYEGDFDVNMIVRAAPLPKSSSLDDHRYAWTAMRRLFDDEWEAYRQGKEAC